MGPACPGERTTIIPYGAGARRLHVPQRGVGMSMAIYMHVACQASVIGGGTVVVDGTGCRPISPST
jgi:hypothetical protein